MSHNAKAKFSGGWDSTEEGSYLYWLNRQRVYRADENEWTERKRVPEHVQKLEKSRIYFLGRAMEWPEYEILTTRSFDSEGRMSGFMIHLMDYGRRFDVREEERPVGAYTFRAMRFDMATKIAFSGGKMDLQSFGLVWAHKFTHGQAKIVWGRFLDWCFPFRVNPNPPKPKTLKQIRAEERRHLGPPMNNVP